MGSSPSCCGAAGASSMGSSPSCCGAAGATSMGSSPSCCGATGATPSITHGTKILRGRAAVGYGTANKVHREPNLNLSPPFAPLRHTHQPNYNANAHGPGPTPPGRHTNAGRPVSTRSHESKPAGLHVPRSSWDGTHTCGEAEAHHHASPGLARHDANTHESLRGGGRNGHVHTHT